MPGFPLAAIGAGIGQGAEAIQKQREAELRNALNAIAIANQKRQEQTQEGLYKALNQGGLEGLVAFGGAPPAVTQQQPFPQTQATQPPVQSQPGQYGGMSVPSGSGALNQMLQQANASLPSGYRATITSGDRPGATVVGTGGPSQHSLGNAIDVQIIGPNGPIPNTGDDTTGLYRQLALAMRQAASPDLQSKLAWGGNFTTGPQNGPRDLMHFDLGGDRGRFGTLSQEAASLPPDVKTQVGQGIQQTAQTIPPDVYGMASLQAIARRVEQTNPDAPPAVKMMIVEGLQKLMAPGEQHKWELFMEQSREQFQRDTTLLVQQQSDERQRRTFEQQNQLLDRRLGSQDSKGYTLMQPPDGGQAIWVKPGSPSIPVEAPAGSTKLGTGSQQPPNPQSVDFVAKGIADYTLAPLTSSAMRAPYGQQVMAKVKELNPEYDQTKYQQKQRGAIAMTTGRQGDTIRSFSVSIDHLAALEEAGEALKSGDVQLLNRAQNALRQQFGYEGPVDFEFIKSIVGDEVAKAVIGAVGASADRQQLQAGFNAANSPEQLAGVVKMAKKLIAGQLGGLRRQAGTASFSEQDFDKAISPRARQELGGLQPGAAQTEQVSYKSPDDVKAAVEAGTIDRDAGVKILREQFGYE